jgi:hypothetical protein
MKFLISLALILATLPALAQNYLVAVGSGTPITGPIGGRASLTVNSAPVIYLSINGVQDTNLSNGLVSVQTGGKTSGSMQTGATFNAGGSFNVSSDDLGTIFNGSNVSGTKWTVVFLANGTHYYTLSGSLTNPAGDSGAFVLETEVADSVTCFFSGLETISSASITLTVGDGDAARRLSRRR